MSAGPDKPAELDEPVDRKIPGFALSLLFLVMFQGMAGAVVMLGAVVVIVVAAIVSDANPLQASMGAPMVWLTALGNTFATALLLKIGAVWSRRPWSELLPFGRFAPALLPALAIAGAGLSVLLSDVDNLLRYFLPMPELLMQIMGDLTQSGPASFVILVIVAPWTEELLFRGFVMNGFLKRYRPGSAVVLSALSFAIFHLNPYQLVNAFVLGLLLGWTRLKTGSLWPCIFLHAVANGLVFVCMLLPVEIPGYNVLEEHSFQPWWFDLMGVALAAGGLLLTYRIGTRRAEGP